jgi:hypothetical protein
LLGWNPTCEFNIQPARQPLQSTLVPLVISSAGNAHARRAPLKPSDRFEQQVNTLVLGQRAGVSEDQIVRP